MNLSPRSLQALVDLKRELLSRDSPSAPKRKATFHFSKFAVAAAHARGALAAPYIPAHVPAARTSLNFCTTEIKWLTSHRKSK
jgi:hypothetical protein